MPVPVTTPVLLDTEAMPLLALNHVPPDVGQVSVVVAPTQIGDVPPEIADGDGLTEITAVEVMALHT